MSIDSTSAHIAKRLAAIDLTGPAQKRRELSDSRSRIDGAIDKGREQLEALFQKEAQIRANERDGRNAADALLSGNRPEPIDPDRIAAEREELKAGLRELRDRSEQLALEINECSGSIVAQIGDAVQPLAALLEEEARTAAVALARLYATARAVADATGESAHVDLARQLRELVATAAVEGLIPGGRNAQIEVEPEAVAMLRAGHQSIEFAKRCLSAHVPVPDPTRFPVVFAPASAAG